MSEKSLMNEKSERAEDRLAAFTRDRRILLLSSFALVIGCVSAFVAYALVWLISVITSLAFYQRFSTGVLSPDRNTLGPLVVVVPVVGGLIIGLTARYGSEKIRGHGIPEALEAILFGRSRMSAEVAVLRPLSSAISIGTGGPFGAEGPIIMTGRAVGSLFAQMFHLSAAERRTLLVAGAAGGMAAIFAAPVSAVLIAVELLLFEWRPRSYIPVTVASAVAAALRVHLLGHGPVFNVTAHAPVGAELLLVNALVGLLIGKSLVWSIALGSGTSGGVLAPLLMMGGALGALASRYIPIGDAGLWATIGMAAMMGGTMRSPLTAMVFTLELTSDFNLFPALLVGCVAAYAVTVLLLRRSILTEKVARRGYHITREYSVDPLAVLWVGEVMDEDPPTVPASMKVAELSDRIAHRDPRLTKRQGIPVVDDEGRLAGIITRGDVLRAIEEGANSDTTVL